MMAQHGFALNHMVAPRRGLAGFFSLAQALGLRSVEIRNDLSGVAIADGTPAAAVREAATAAGLSIISINALQRFNDWSETRAAEAQRLIDYAADCGAAALVLCPVNDTAFMPGEADRLRGLRQALRALGPRLSDAGLTGLVEPLGFAECSLRYKREAVEAIGDVDGTGSFKLVHDTFHHHVAGETELFAASTGLVHVSGVVDPEVPVTAMRDPHRVLVTVEDRIDNIGQIRALQAQRYAGPLSFEPFAPSVHGLADIATALRASMTFITAALELVAG